MDEGRDWLTTKEVAESLGVSRMRVRQWIEDGRLPAQKVGGVHLIGRPAMEAMRGRRTTPGPEKGTPRRPRATPKE